MAGQALLGWELLENMAGSLFSSHSWIVRILTIEGGLEQFSVNGSHGNIYKYI